MKPFLVTAALFFSLASFAHVDGTADIKDSAQDSMGYKDFDSSILFPKGDDDHLGKSVRRCDPGDRRGTRYRAEGQKCFRIRLVCTAKGTWQKRATLVAASRCGIRVGEVKPNPRK